MSIMGPVVGHLVQDDCGEATHALIALRFQKISAGRLDHPLEEIGGSRHAVSPVAYVN
jgi:hypothetical protein